MATLSTYVSAVATLKFLQGVNSFALLAFMQISMHQLEAVKGGSWGLDSYVVSPEKSVDRPKEVDNESKMEKG